MREITPVETIDARREIAHVSEFLRSRWEGLPEGDGLARMVRALADQAAVDARHWIDDISLSSAAYDRYDRRTALLDTLSHMPAVSRLAFYDTAACVLYDLARSTRTLREVGVNLSDRWDFSPNRWDFSRQARAAHDHALSAQPGWDDACPTHWAQWKEQFEREGQTQGPGSVYARESFGGVYASTEGLPIPERVSPAAVVFDFDRSGRKPSQSLSGAIYAHFLFVVEHNNTAGLLRELQAIDLKEDLPQPNWDVPTLRSDNPLMQAWLLGVRADRLGPKAQADFEEMGRLLAKPQELSPQDRAARADRLAQEILVQAKEEDACNRVDPIEQAMREHLQHLDAWPDSGDLAPDDDASKAPSTAQSQATDPAP